MNSEVDVSRFRVRHGPEIERVLHAVQASKSLVTLERGDGKEFLVTTLVGIDGRRREFSLAASADAGLNARLLASERLQLTTMEDQVRVQFNAQGGREERVAGETLFVFPVPADILYFQRREYYRLPTSLVNPVLCHIPVGNESVEAVFLDISLGGGMLSLKSGPGLTDGTLYTDCRLSLILPGSEPLPVSLIALKTFTVPLQNGQFSHRACCQFYKLPRGIEDAIQRFILQVERERRQREQLV